LDRVFLTGINERELFLSLVLSRTYFERLMVFENVQSNLHVVLRVSVLLYEHPFMDYH
jgi:hypothetical protein